MTEPAPHAINPDLADVHRRLVALAGSLDSAIDGAPDAAAVRTLTRQIAEVNARVTAVGRQLMARRTDAIRDAARDVSAAVPQLERALRSVERTEALVAGVTAVLALVDKAVDTARTAG